MNFYFDFLNHFDETVAGFEILSFVRI